MEKLGMFDHHPNPAIDFCVEADCLKGLVCDAEIGLEPATPLVKRMSRALRFQVGGDGHAIDAKRDLWGTAAKLSALTGVRF